MSYFSRLTDIVTCNLSDILAGESDPAPALQGIIAEMEEGLAGANRSVATARASLRRIEEEIEDHSSRAESCIQKAKEHLAGEDETQARVALLRKQEIDDVVAGLEQQLKAARSTAEHLSTTQRALEARLAEARRKLQRLESGIALTEPDESEDSETSPAALESLDQQRAQRIEAELDALKQQMG